MSELDKAARRKIIAATLAEAVQVRLAEIERSKETQGRRKSEHHGMPGRTGDSPARALPRAVEGGAA